MNGEQLLDELRRLAGKSWTSFAEINDAYETLCRRAGIDTLRVRDETSLAFRSGKSFYRLPLERIRRLEGVFVRQEAGNWRRLELGNDDSFDREVRRSASDDGSIVPGTPRVYRSAGDEIEVAPTPNGTYPARLVYIGNPVPLDRQGVPILPSNYHRIIAKMAASYVLRESTDEGDRIKGARYDQEVREAMLGFAFDTSPGTGDVSVPRQRIQRV